MNVCIDDGRSTYAGPTCTPGMILGSNAMAPGRPVRTGEFGRIVIRLKSVMPWLNRAMKARRSSSPTPESVVKWMQLPAVSQEGASQRRIAQGFAIGGNAIMKPPGRSPTGGGRTPLVWNTLRNWPDCVSYEPFGEWNSVGIVGSAVQRRLGLVRL